MSASIQRVSASCGVQLDQQGDVLVVGVHPLLQLLFILSLFVCFAVGYWAGKPSEADDDETETEEESK